MKGTTLLHVLRYIIFIFILCFNTHTFASENPDELYRLGKFEDAEKAYAQSDMDNPKDIRFRYNRGCAAFQNADFKTAKASFTSVLKRTETKEIKFKASFNLGNAAFKEGDFASALKSYSLAIQHDPMNEDARYNLELTLREIEKQKKQKEEQEKQGDNKEQKEEGDKKENSDQSPSKNDKGDQENKNESDKNKEPEKKNGSQDKKDPKQKQDKPKDLSGDLKSSQPMPEEKENQKQQQPESTLDKKKAEALLDNLKEDRTRFLRFQVPEDKKHGVKSGKDW